MNDLSKEEIMPLDFLRMKFPLWDIQDRLEFNTVMLREENLIEAMQEYADQQAKKEAIGFMEWKEDEGYECVRYDDVKMWQKKGTKPCSSEQLYNLYIQSKQQ